MTIAAYRPSGSTTIPKHGSRRLTSVSDLADAVTGWRVSPLTGGPRVDTLRNWRGRRLMCTDYTGGGVAFTRSDADLSDTYQRYTQIAFLHHGRVTMTRDGRTEICEPGSVAALRLDSSYESITEPGSELTLLYVPTDVIDARGIESRRVNGLIWQAGPVEAAILELSDRMHDLAGPESTIVEAGIIEMIIGLLSSHDAAEHEDVASHTRARVLALIDENYTQTDLDAAMIARRLGVSRRYLYTLFEGRGISVAALIRNRRVTHAERLLLDEHDMPLRRVAQLSGLGSEDRLLRTFKTVLGVSPSSYRREARAEALAQSLR